MTARRVFRRQSAALPLAVSWIGAASPATDQREALTRRCPLHPNRSQALVVEWPLPKTALDE